VDHDEDHAGEADDAHDHDGVDPHIWMSPANAKVMVENIAQALVQRDPANADIFRTNAEAYQQQLDELDQWVESEVQQIAPENRKLVADHSTFGYFADRYGFAQIGTVIPSFSTNAEPSAQELAALQQAVAEHDVKAVFVGTTVNAVLSNRLAEDTGINVVPLYTGSLGVPGSGAETYLDFIRYNTTAIVKALK
jgi:ABC-type Zn uptake system ZnuABC Zn-binding protein ZnuA